MSRRAGSMVADPYFAATSVGPGGAVGARRERNRKLRHARVDRARRSGRTDRELRRLPRWRRDRDHDDPEYIDNSLAAGTTYKYAVDAIDTALDRSHTSTAIQVTTN